MAFLQPEAWAHETGVRDVGEPESRRAATRSPRAVLGWPRLLLAAALLFALWYTWPTKVSPDLAETAREHAARTYPWVQLGEPVSQTGRFGRYEVTLSGQRTDEQLATITVTLRKTSEGLQVTGSAVALKPHGDLWRRIAQLIMVAAFLILVFFWAVPRTFGRRCPRDGTLLQLSETAVSPPRYDLGLVTRPGIIQRTWTCPRCDFGHAEALPDPLHRPMVYVDPAFASTPQARIDEIVDRIIEDRRRDALARAITDEQYAEELAQARKRAAESTSRDSPWQR